MTIDEAREFFKFLHGEVPFRDTWFGENAHDARGLFWWRKHLDDAIAALTAPAAPQQAEPVAWREHVEQRLRAWKQPHINRSGDQLALDDFMGAGDIDSLIDYVCDEWADPPPAAEVQRLREALKPFAAIDLTTNQAVDAMDVLRARRALEGK